MIFLLSGGKFMSELKEIREIVLVNIKEVVRQNKEKVEEAEEKIIEVVGKVLNWGEVLQR